MNIGITPTGSLSVNNTFVDIKDYPPPSGYNIEEITNSTITNISYNCLNFINTSLNSHLIISNKTPDDIVILTEPLTFWSNYPNLRYSIFGHTHFELNPLGKQLFNKLYKYDEYFNDTSNEIQRFQIGVDIFNTKYINPTIINFNIKTQFNFINIRRTYIF
jgi:hypothetical protein